MTDASRQSNPGSNGAERIRIVVADDLPEMLEAVEQRLAPEYEIVGKASDGLALVECVTKMRPDLLVTDISMPKLSGLEALRRLRQLGVETPAVVLTIHDDEELFNEAFSLGAHGFVIKPQLETDLRVAVREVLAGRSFVSKRLKQTSRR